MLFSEKLAKLRKANGMSQEDLANYLNVSRQAVSKWENNQGYPEMEKLLVMGNLFQVSMDYLLKEEPSKQNEQESGYYVSREVAQGYLQRERKDTVKIGIAVMLFICCGVPVACWPQREEVMSIVTMIIIAIGVIILTVMAFQTDPYKHLSKEPLLFDRNVLQDIKSEYGVMRKRYIGMIVVGIILIFSGMLFNIYFDDIIGMKNSPMDAGFLLFVGGAVFLFIYGGSMSSSYEMLIENETYLENKKKGNILYAYTLGIAFLIYIAIGRGFGNEYYKTMWVILPIVAILTSMYLHFKSAKKD